ncbi:hypothetical protein SteCoe_11898 [Stentor coeruleus]|uniref:Cyclic nucleotide-binding domain-containing protein n=1 Tax=Stentor coeruleus TaxID=5963 RepID=A0A1R2CC14_9CILI|nr:hypothetical protein SteCoe_11898 [Stentor coeruleus]
MEELDKALKVLRNKDRTFEELEWLSEYLMCLEDYRNYARNLSQVLIIQLVRNFTLAFVKRKQKVFRKGEPALMWFLVLDGELEISNTLKNENKLVCRVTKGKQIGEREVLRNKVYSNSCFPSRNTWLLCLAQKDFVSLLGDELNTRLMIIRNFVHSYLPHLHLYSPGFKEKVGYLFTLKEYRREETVVNKDDLDDKLYFVFDGEVAVFTEHENRAKNVVKLGKGMCFAEECTLLNKPCLFNIRVSSERAVIASIRRSEMYMLPDETLDSLKKNLQDKVKSRKNLLFSGVTVRNNNSANASPDFRSANRQAREKLISYIIRNKPCTPKRILSISRVRNKTFKEHLEVLRDCSPRRIKITSGFTTYREFKKKRENSLPLL